MYDYAKQCISFFLGNPPPGILGGGASPSAVGAGAVSPANLANLGTALSLVPAGLTAVAVFPPYNTPRQFPSVSVIFAEDTNLRYCDLLNT